MHKHDQCTITPGRQWCRWLVPVLASLALGCTPGAQADDDAGPDPQAEAAASPGARVDALVRKRIESVPLASAAVTVIKDGVPIKSAAYGMADIDHGIGADKGTVYRLDSVTKQFTASAIMVLSQQNRIDIDAPVSQYLPNTPPAWRDIKVRNLLNHTAGFPHDNPAGYPTIYTQDCGPLDQSLSLLYQMSPPAGFHPGDQWEYSNAGYAVLAAVLRQVTGGCYSDALGTLLFTPANMHATALDYLFYQDPRLAIGYEWNASTSQWQEVPQLNSSMGAGALKTTLWDMAQWERALEGNQILSEQSKALMYAPTVLNDGKVVQYGFAWMLARNAAGQVLHHNGIGWGYNTAFYRYPDSGYAVAVLTNTREAGSSQADWLATHIAALYVPGLVPAPKTAQ